MADVLPRLCVFGDSHYACLKQAEVQGLVDVSGVDLEYWGHVGGRFRHLEFRDGAVHPLDDFTAMRFAKFNAKGRLFLPAADFDWIHVTGARVYAWRLFYRTLRGLTHGPFLSSGLMRRLLVDGLRAQQGYRLAMGLAATGTARVLLSPVAYYTADSDRFTAMLTPEIMALVPTHVPMLWEIIEQAAQEDGITLLRQPETTVTRGFFTDEAYAVANHVEKQDFEHHNAAYGALILARAVEIVRQGSRGVAAAARAGQDTGRRASDAGTSRETAARRADRRG
ncbi:MAG: hypothetical protein MUE83_10525 [Tabrizicola sp.]|nr:hypothetical protein [Tabrizicola sp.]